MEKDAIFITMIA